MQLHYFGLPRMREASMNAILEADSTLTDRYQTTIPEPVRRALGLQKRDAIHYEVLPDGEVRMSRRVDHDADSVISAFLALLETDIATKAGSMSQANADLVVSIQHLVRGVDVDLDAALSPDDE